MTKTTKTTKTRRPVSKVKRTAASIGASAAPGRCELLNLCNFTRTADDIVKGEMKNKSYSEVLKKVADSAQGSYQGVPERLRHGVPRYPYAWHERSRACQKAQRDKP